MTTKRQILCLIIVVIISQVIGQFIPPYSIFIGTTVIVPLSALIICFFLGKNEAHFHFEIKAAIVISAVALSAIIDYFFAPETHDDQGIAWVALFWTYGLCVLFWGLAGAKLYNDFPFKKLGFNFWTFLSISELLTFISIPLLYNVLFWKVRI